MQTVPGDSMQMPVNGKTGDLVRWLIGVAAAAAVAYFTTVSAINRELGEVRSTEHAHHSQNSENFKELKDDIRELRRALAEAERRTQGRGQVVERQFDR